MYCKMTYANRLDKKFFANSAMVVAPSLIGKLICTYDGAEVTKYVITETECYSGTADTACHASKGRTSRTDVMFGEGGRLYVYLCYGLHYMLNIVTGVENHPEAVLIRGLQGAIGPGRVTALLGIGKRHNGTDVTTDSKIWFEDSVNNTSYVATPRIGIGYADAVDRERLWRFVATNYKV